MSVTNSLLFNSPSINVTRIVSYGKNTSVLHVVASCGRQRQHVETAQALAKLNVLNPLMYFRQEHRLLAFISIYNKQLLYIITMLGG